MQEERQAKLVEFARVALKEELTEIECNARVAGVEVEDLIVLHPHKGFKPEEEEILLQKFIHEPAIRS